MKKRKFCDLAPNCGCHAEKAPSTESIDRHEAELTKRLAWCIANKYIPAHDHVHKAPGDDANFVYGVPPWNKDGSINPQGVYCAPLTKVEQLFTELEKEKNVEWYCKACDAKINSIPRKWTRTDKPEPWNWWYCLQCKSSKSKPSKKQLMLEHEKASNHDIKTWFK